MTKKVLSQLTQVELLTIEMAGHAWSSRPVSHLLNATPASPLALPSTLTKLHVAKVDLWLDELAQVFGSCPALNELEVSNLRGNCTRLPTRSLGEGRVQLARVVVHRTTLTAAQLAWLFGHCLTTAFSTLDIALPGFDLSQALRETLNSISRTLEHLHLRNRFTIPKSTPAPSASATATAASKSDATQAASDPACFVRDILTRTANLNSFTLEIGMCPATPDPADGVASLLESLPRSVRTLRLDGSVGSAALRAGIVAHLQAVEDSVEGATSLAQVVTVSVAKKSEGSESKSGRQSMARLEEFGVEWTVAGAETGAVAV